MPGFNQLMMRVKGKQLIPANVVFTNVDSNNYITYKSRDGQTYWRKKYAGLCYGGFCVFQDGGQNWIIAFTISEVKNNCIMYRDDGNTNITLEISSSTLNYKGKDWYYSLNSNANNYRSITSSIIEFNKNNGRYWIGGENKIYTGSNNNEKFIQVAKDFLDYIYTFDVEASTKEYTYLNYVETSGSQYIKTGLYAYNTALQNYSFEIKVNFSNISENAIVISSWSASAYFLMCYQSKIRWHGSSSGSSDIINISTNTDYIIKVDIQNGQIIINGNSYPYTAGSCGTSQINLFGLSGGNYSSKGLVGKTYYAKFYDIDGNLIRHYTPVIRNSDGQVGMLEQVNNIFCPNDGSGDFIGG